MVSTDHEAAAPQPSGASIAASWAVFDSKAISIPGGHLRARWAGGQAGRRRGLRIAGWGKSTAGVVTGFVA
jgi:hypothetical protein